MDNTEYCKENNLPLDAGVEWFIKGANIGLIYAYAFRSEVMPMPSKLMSIKHMSSYMFRTSVFTGGVLGIWWFFIKTFENITKKDFWLNYSLSGIVIFNVWSDRLNLNPAAYKMQILSVVIFTGVLGKIISNTNQASDYDNIRYN
ncbi:hypothetical protein SteCoe_13852 [Stentor coeruleus]|uniref:Uncharacterized protein n=1 Tax=Stentor coeruleus TaxID=5963 RepID=A0A1R2C7E7_9CILI|nr:hypothetical protein SteCoe_13852 [Stentor coeruleus]